MLPKLVGSHWVWIYDGKEWPVVLCGDDIPPKAFLETRKHPGETAAILLGKRKYLWVLEDRLQEYEPHKDYLQGLPRYETDDDPKSDDDAAKVEKQRRIAFRQDAPELQSPEYWKNFIGSQREARRLEREMSNNSGGKKKRKRTMDDDGLEIVDVRSSSSPTNSMTKRHSPGGRISKNGRQLPTPGQTPIKGKARSYPGLPICAKDGGNIESESEEEDEGGRPATSLQDPFSDEVRDRRLQEPRVKHEQTVVDNAPKREVFTIFVGDSKTPFQAPRDSVGQSEILSQHIRFTEALRNYVDISEISDVSAKDFVPVSEYLQHSDFAPRLIEKPNDVPRLQGLLFPEERDRASEKCAYVFRTASYLQLGGLQSLCVNKLKVLYPLPPLQILIVAKIYERSDAWGCDAETEFLDWLVDHVSEYYWSLTEKHGERLVEVLDSSEDLRRRVIEKISEDKGMGRRGLNDDF